MLILPRYGTRRRPERPTSGAGWAVVADMLGMRLMPEQRYALDVAGELVPDETGQLIHAYSTVVLSEPRRSGKTFKVLARILGALVSQPRARAWYTAQSRALAATVLLDEWVPWVDNDASAVAQLVVPRVANGSEALRVPSLHSICRLFAPTPTALHSAAGDVIVFDEAWAHTRERGAELDIAARPLMATRPGAQLWKVSAAGDIDSTWWVDALDRGRAAAVEDSGRGICHLEWTADDPELDPDDEATWLATYPAIRTADHPTGTVPLDFLREEHDRDPLQFRRLWLNITDRAGTAASPIDLDRWAALTAAPTSRTLPISLGVASGPEQASTAIVAAIVPVDSDGTRWPSVLEVVDHRPGQEWAADRLIELYASWPVDTVALAAQGPARPLVEPLEAQGVPVRQATLQDQHAAAVQLVAAVRSDEVRHVPDDALTAAAAGARRRKLADGSWLFGRVESEQHQVDVAPLEAAALARWAHRDVYRPPPPVH